MRIENLIKINKEYGPIPFWFWNDKLDKDTLDRELQEMRKQHIYEFIIHARKGLKIDYLSDEWFEIVEFVVKKAREYGMTCWIYDEENWPSGYCGGRVIEENENYCAKNLRMTTTTIKALNQDMIDKSVAILIKKQEQYRNIKGYLDEYSNHEEIICFIQEDTKWHPAYFDGYYTDLLNIDATKTFMKYTHKEYEKRLKEYFGSIIKGFFTDEPGFYQNLYMFPDREDINTIVWTIGFLEYFNKENGYSILEKLPHLWIDSKESHKTRYDYYQTVTKMVIKNFYQPMKDFCHEHNMKLIGHVDFEDFLHMQVSVQGDMTKVVGTLDYAGVDKIDQNNEKIVEKVISSIGHMYNHKRVLSETYALTGWGLDFQEMKRIADYQYVRGINLLNPHAFYYSIEEDRKWECPPSQFRENPYWPYYHRFSDYITRLSYLLSQGHHVADIAVYYPMPTAYDVYKPNDKDDVVRVDQLLQNLTFTLLENQYDFDFINDEVISNAKIENEHLVMHNEKFRLIILPHVTTMTLETTKKLKQFIDSDGILLILETIPCKCVDIDKQNEFNDLFKEINQHKNTYFMDDYMLTKSYTYKFDIKKFDIIYHQIMKKEEFFKLDPHLDIALFDLKNHDGLRKDVVLDKHDPHIKYLHRRNENIDCYYIINEDDEKRSNKISLKCIGLLKELDLYDGSIKEVVSRQNGDYQTFEVTLPPYGSKLFVIDTSLQVETVKEKTIKEKVVRYIDDWEITIDNTTFNTKLKSWEELGFPYYSGEAIYKNNIVIREDDLLSNKIELIIDNFRDCVELSINGQVVDVKIWETYQFSIKDYLKIGDNIIEMKVINTLLNRFNKQPRTSGLVNAVKISITS